MRKRLSGALISTTERLLLLVPNGALAGRMAEYATRNFDFHRHAMPTPPEGYGTRSYWKRQLRKVQENFRTGSSYRFVFLAKDNPGEDVVGDCTFNHVVGGVLSSAVLGYKLDRRWEGKGVMTEALEALLPFMFTQVGLHRIEANVRPENQRSYRLLRRLGFALEGFSGDYLMLDGVWRDHLRLAKVNPAYGSGTLPTQELATFGLNEQGQRIGLR